MTVEFLQGDCLEVMRGLPDESINCCVTSPPYYGLRNYNCDGQIGLENTPDEYVNKLVEVFREVKRLLRGDGILWLNLGDSYSSDKNMIGIPWKVAFALQADGWYLRQDIIWNKPNPMPESVKDRCTKAHEYIFLLSKSAKYHFDSDAIKESAVSKPVLRDKNSEGYQADYPEGDRFSGGARTYGADGMRNKRSVWTVTPKPYKGAHFATFPPDLIEPCIAAGCPVNGTVLDPFGGAGTTGLVAEKLNANAILIELNPDYIKLAKDRICA